MAIDYLGFGSKGRLALLLVSKLGFFLGLGLHANRDENSYQDSGPRRRNQYLVHRPSASRLLTEPGSVPPCHRCTLPSQTLRAAVKIQEKKGISLSSSSIAEPGSVPPCHCCHCASPEIEKKAANSTPVLQKVGHARSSQKHVVAGTREPEKCTLQNPTADRASGSPTAAGVKALSPEDGRTSPLPAPWPRK